MGTVNYVSSTTNLQNLRRLLCLFHDENCPECLEAAQLLDLLGVSHTKIPCKEMLEAEMGMGIGHAHLDGIKEIRRVILSGQLQAWLDEEKN